LCNSPSSLPEYQIQWNLESMLVKNGFVCVYLEFIIFFLRSTTLWTSALIGRLIPGTAVFFLQVLLSHFQILLTPKNKNSNLLNFMAHLQTNNGDKNGKIKGRFIFNYKIKSPLIISYMGDMKLNLYDLKKAISFRDEEDYKLGIRDCQDWARDYFYKIGGSTTNWYFPHDYICESTGLTLIRVDHNSKKI